MKKNILQKNKVYKDYCHSNENAYFYWEKNHWQYHSNVSIYIAFTIVWKRCCLQTFIWTFHFACNTFEIHAHQKTFQFPLESTTFSSCISISKWDNFAYYFIGTKMFSLSFQKHIQVRIVQNQDEPNQGTLFCPKLSSINNMVQLK